ncbi:hypothetical protein Taro_047020 [Colocasia esculenta]|uniref:Uncharacterized protein n=1 Tax=Colocasia esculenta TaxID=4460 RepID=A0A843X4X1_COLES|nr:hypothetical protein [Colocasia esculenta]
MVGSWATFAASFTEDDLLLLPSPEFDDDDPSSYLLYPPGFGPVADWPVDGGNLPMLSCDSAAADPCGSGRKGADVVVNGGREGTAVNGSGASELLGLSEALLGKVSLMEGCASGCGGKDGVVEYMVIGSLDGSVNGEGVVDVSRTSGAAGGPVLRLEISKEDGDGGGKDPPPVVKTDLKVEDIEEINLENGGSSSSSSSSSEESSEEEEDDSDEDEDDDDGRYGGKRERMDEVVDFEEGEIRDLDAEELAVSGDDDEDGGVKGPVRSKNELELFVVPEHWMVDTNIKKFCFRFFHQFLL